MKLVAAVRYVLSVPTNVVLIISSALGYFFVSGISTFGVVFIRHHYSVGQSVATSLLAVVAVGRWSGCWDPGASPTRCMAQTHRWTPPGWTSSPTGCGGAPKGYAPCSAR